MKNEYTTVLYDGKPIEVKCGEPLSLALRTESPCGAHGNCGKCKAKVTGDISPLTESERSHLSKEEMNRGIRLLCQVCALGGAEVTSLYAEKELSVLTEGVGAITVENPLFQNFGIAIDIGTTTLAGRLYQRDGKVLATAGATNPQVVYGADVISRIEHARQDKNALAHAIREGLSSLILSLTEQADILPEDVDGMVLCGNTTMLYLLTETDTEPLSHAPFSLTRSFGEFLSASELALSPLKPDTKVYLPRVISAFVGADTVCALLATRITEKADTTLLVDIGTNGEIALWHEGVLRVTSTAAGPAFEGVGIQAGMRGETGAIDRVSLEGDTLIVHTIGDTEPKGICGSGLVDLIACLLKHGTLDESGYLESDFPLTRDVILTQKDVREVQLAKSAISAGIRTLLHMAKCPPEEVGRFVVCGGFGSYLNLENANAIGLLPTECTSHAEIVGNAALDGASVFLLQGDHILNAQNLVESAIPQNLSETPVFAEFYMMGMLLSEEEK